MKKSIEQNKLEQIVNNHNKRARNNNCYICNRLIEEAAAAAANCLHYTYYKFITINK